MARAKKPKVYQLKDREQVHVIEDDAIMSPTTRMVDNPDWDPNAPEVELDERVVKAKKAMQARARARQRIKRRVTSTPHLLAFLAGGLITVAAVGFGVRYMLEQQEVELRARAQAELEAQRAAEAQAEADAKAEVELNKQLAQSFYRTRVELASEALGIPPLSLDELRKPNSFTRHVRYSEPAMVGSGKSTTLGPLSLRVVTETMTLERQTINSKGAHTSLVLTNTSEHALAYRLEIRKAEAGECKMPGIMNYDALVLDAGQRVEISVCSGRHTVEIVDLRTMEMTPLGARWVRQIPPKALGFDDLTVRAHEVDEGIEQCHEDAARIARELSEDLIRWEDVIDYFSRHDCNEYAWWSGYRYAEAPLGELPVVAPGTAGPIKAKAELP